MQVGAFSKTKKKMCNSCVQFFRPFMTDLETKTQQTALLNLSWIVNIKRYLRFYFNPGFGHIPNKINNSCKNSNASS